MSDISDISVVEPLSAIIELMRSATDDVLIVAPYIKAHALQRLISVIPDTVTRLICVTRWLPEDIASGACDLEIFDLVADRLGGVLRIHPHLHAKYYRTSSLAMIGSANITARALGWSSPPNIELLVQLPVDLPGLVQWEERLLGSTLPATVELRDQIAEQAARLKVEGAVAIIPEVETQSPEPDASGLWFPECPVPDRLWEVYRSAGVDTMVSSAREGAEHDLIALAPPKGLSKDLFEAYITGILKQIPIIEDIDRLSTAGLSDNQAKAFLTEKLGTDIAYNHEEVWRILKHWMIHFFPANYRLETAQEVLIKGKEIRRQ